MGKCLQSVEKNICQPVIVYPGKLSSKNESELSLVQTKTVFTVKSSTRRELLKYVLWERKGTQKDDWVQEGMMIYGEIREKESMERILFDPQNYWKGSLEPRSSWISCQRRDREHIVAGATQTAKHLLLTTRPPRELSAGYGLWKPGIAEILCFPCFLSSQASDSKSTWVYLTNQT